MLQTESLLAKIGFDTAENGPSKFWYTGNGIPVHRYGHRLVPVKHIRPGRDIRGGGAAFGAAGTRFAPWAVSIKRYDSSGRTIFQSVFLLAVFRLLKHAICNMSVPLCKIIRILRISATLVRN